MTVGNSKARVQYLHGTMPVLSTVLRRAIIQLVWTIELGPDSSSHCPTLTHLPLEQALAQGFPTSACRPLHPRLNLETSNNGILVINTWCA